MSDKYKDTFRVLMIDQHFPDAPYITFSRFDAADQVRRCKDAAIDSLHVTTKCHWGHSYYRTETGLMHPALKGRDMVGELVAESRRAGIEAIAYYCILFENLAARNHRDWRFITKEGKPAIRNELFGATGADSWRWDMPCFMTGYRQYCLDQIAEIAAGYEFDGLFLDIFALGSDQRINVCHCAACLARYAERGLDPHSDDPQMKFALVKHWMANWAEFLLEIKGVLRDHRPGMSVSVNGGPFYEPWSVLKELSWPYSEGGENPHNSVVLRGLGLGSPQCGIPCGNDAYDAWPPDLVKIMTSTVLAHGCRTFFFFLQGRLGDGTFEESKYDFVRRINEETAAKQEYVKDAEPLKAAAVYHSEATWMEYGSRDCRTRHAGNIQVAIDAFRAVSIPCEFLPSWRIEPADLDPFQLVVLPEQKCVSDREAEALARYVRKGGHPPGDRRHRNARQRGEAPVELRPGQSARRGLRGGLREVQLAVRRRLHALRRACLLRKVAQDRLRHRRRFPESAGAGCGGACPRRRTCRSGKPRQLHRLALPAAGRQGRVAVRYGGSARQGNGGLLRGAARPARSGRAVVAGGAYPGDRGSPAGELRLPAGRPRGCLRSDVFP
ncbi:MAG: hypothetical protein QF541_13775 [Lentisphaeria bacterium]|jgi:hypothetical protein|nr:hypothetical protein [Lentisphaeria bacterium]